MAEYINRDLALSFLFGRGEYDHKNANPHFVNGCETYREWLVQIPAADVVKVVRCRGCRMSEPCADERERYCTLTHAYKPTEYFCADGEMDEEVSDDE